MTDEQLKAAAESQAALYCFRAGRAHMVIAQHRSWDGRWFVWFNKAKTWGGGVRPGRLYSTLQLLLDHHFRKLGIELYGAVTDLSSGRKVPEQWEEFHEEG